jgi:hypothetical protein
MKKILLFIAICILSSCDKEPRPFNYVCSMEMKPEYGGEIVNDFFYTLEDADEWCDLDYAVRCACEELN